MGTFMPNMGMPAADPHAPSGLADALFSGTRQRVLALLFGQPARSFYATELIRLAGSGSGAVQRELANLERAGLVTVRAVGSQKHYQANPAAPIFIELCGIVQKTVGLAEPLRDALQPLRARIDAAFVDGSVARQADHAASNVDLLLLSDTLAYADVFGALEAAAAKIGRSVNPTIVTRQDFKARLDAREAFLTRVLEQPKLWIFGGESELPV